MRIRNFTYIFFLLLLSCKSESEKLSEKLIGKHEIIELVIGEKKEELGEVVYLKIEKDGLLFLENGKESKPFGEWHLDSTCNAVIFNIVNENFNAKLNFIEDDSTFTLRGYSLGEQKIFYSFKFSKTNNLKDKNTSTENAEVQDTSSSLELIKFISYCLQIQDRDWRATGRFGIPVKWETESFESTNENLKDKGSFERRGAFIPKINGNDYYGSEWSIALYGTFHYFSRIELDSYSAPEFDGIDIIEYLSKYYSTKLIRKQLIDKDDDPNDEHSYGEVYSLKSETYGNGEIFYWKSCGTVCSVHIEI